MAVERRPISVSQLAELLGVDPQKFVAVEHRCDHGLFGWYVVTEVDDANIRDDAAVERQHDPAKAQG